MCGNSARNQSLAEGCQSPVQTSKSRPRRCHWTLNYWDEVGRHSTRDAKRQTSGHGTCISVGPPMASTQCQRLMPGEATGYSQIVKWPLAVRSCRAALAGPMGFIEGLQRPRRRKIKFTKIHVKQIQCSSSRVRREKKMSWKAPKATAKSPPLAEIWRGHWPA